MRKLALVVVAAMVPAAMLAMAFIGYDYYERERTRLMRDSLSTTRALAAAVDSEFAVVKASLLVLAAASPALAVGDFAGFHAQAVAAIETQNRIVSIVLGDESARQLVNTLRPYGEPLPQSGGPGGVVRAIKTGTPVVSDLFRGRTAESHLVGVVIPVMRDGEARYGLAAGLSAAGFAALLKQQDLPAGRIAAVLDSSGTVVARTHDEARFVGHKASPELLRRSQQAGEDAFHSRTLEGIPVLTIFSRAPESRFTVAIGIPEQELVMTLVHSLARLFIVGFVALLAALLAAWLFGRRFLGRDRPARRA